MSDEQDKDALLVDQKDALDFYFDSLLMSDEAELLEEPQPIAAAKKLQDAKDFLQASKQRQEKQDTQVTHGVKMQPQPSAESEPFHKTAQTITADPVSPKPRPRPRLKPAENHLANKRSSTGSKIVFSVKNDAGETTEQILIPRSQRLAAAKKNQPTSHQDHSIAKTVAQTNSSAAPIDFIDEKPSVSKEPSACKKPSASKEPEIKTAPLKQQHSSFKDPSTVSQEAPHLDLSLFLPKIKKLSEDEIAQQIEALTQAAVSQAQLESDLAHVAELEQVSQKILNRQSATESDGLVRNINNAPSWAVPDFQVLLFTIAGLKLAVPLTELNAIVEWGDKYITELPGHKSWYLGIIQNQGKNVPVIDTLQQVVPGNRWPENYLSERKFKHIIIIDNAHWGLACEEVLEVITLKTDSVKWRSSRTKRRWLLGTVIEHMCALLDGSEFAAMLKTGDDSLLGSWKK